MVLTNRYWRDLYNKINWPYLLLSLLLMAAAWYIAPYIKNMGISYPALFLLGFLSTANIFFPGPIWLAALPLVGEPFLSAVVFSAGSALGEITGYLSGSSLKDLFVKSHLAHLFNKYGEWLLFFMAIVPNPIFDTLGIIAGASGMPWWNFLLPVFLGRLIRYLLLFYGLDFVGPF